MFDKIRNKLDAMNWCFKGVMELLEQNATLKIHAENSERRAIYWEEQASLAVHVERERLKNEAQRIAVYSRGTSTQDDTDRINTLSRIAERQREACADRVGRGTMASKIVLATPLVTDTHSIPPPTGT